MKNLMIIAGIIIVSFFILEMVVIPLCQKRVAEWDSTHARCHNSRSSQHNVTN